MIVNIDTLDRIPDKDRMRILHLLDDLSSINVHLISKIKTNESIIIEYQDWHDECSPESVDPWPDYYGYYRLIFKECNETIGIEMTARDLDRALCLLLDFIEYI